MKLGAIAAYFVCVGGRPWQADCRGVCHQV